MSFGIKVAETALEVEESKQYDHGFSDQEVIMIKEGKKQLDKRLLEGKKPTLLEFKEIVVPWNRINRVEAFILNPEKKKVVRKKAVSTTVKGRAKPKTKKLTKAQIQNRINSIMLKMMSGEKVSEEDSKWYNEQIDGLSL